MSQKHNETGQHHRRDRWFLLVIFFLFLCGIGIRGYEYITRTRSHSRNVQQQPLASKAFPETPGETQAPHLGVEHENFSEDSGILPALAPYLTEGGLSFFLGFCLGYFLRVVAKTLILLVGAIYCCLILLSHYGILVVDWGSFQDALQHILLNTQTHVQDLQGLFAVSLPSVTMGGLGIWRGLKKT